MRSVKSEPAAVTGTTSVESAAGKPCSKFTSASCPSAASETLTETKVYGAGAAVGSRAAVGSGVDVGSGAAVVSEADVGTNVFCGVGVRCAEHAGNPALQHNAAETAIITAQITRIAAIAVFLSEGA